MSSDKRGDRLGPMLHFRSHSDQGTHLTAVLVCPIGDLPGPLRVGTRSIAAHHLSDLPDHAVWRYDFQLGPTDAGYVLDGIDYPVACDLNGDLRIGFVSCIGEEHGDLDRDDDERNAMWARACHRSKAS